MILIEEIHSRVLGAIRFVDATTLSPIGRRLDVAADGSEFVRNRLGLYVVATAPKLEDYVLEFDTPLAKPKLGKAPIVLTVQDPERQYLPRQATIALPRDPDPANESSADSLFQPVDVALFAAPAARTGEGVAVVRASVKRTGTEIGLPAALLRVLRTSDGKVLARGLADDRGEVLLAVPGIPITSWEDGPGPVVSTEVDVSLEAIFDRSADDVPDPDEIEAQRGSLPQAAIALKLASGREVITRIEVATR